MTPSRQSDIVALAEGYADDSRAKMKKMLGWAIGLGIATVALVAAPVAPLLGAAALAGAVMTGSMAFGHHRAEQLMRQAASEAGNENFSDSLKAKAEALASKAKKVQKWGTIGMLGFIAGVAGSLLFPAAAPAFGALRSIGSMIWGYNSLKSFANDAPNTQVSSLSEKVQALALADAAAIPANDDSSGSTLLHSPSPGPAFGRAVTPQAGDDAPVQKTGTKPSITP